jgi:hypothetical protein
LDSATKFLSALGVKAEADNTDALNDNIVVNNRNDLFIKPTPLIIHKIKVNRQRCLPRFLVSCNGKVDGLNAEGVAIDWKKEMQDSVQRALSRVLDSVM